MSTRYTSAAERPPAIGVIAETGLPPNVLGEGKRDGVAVDGGDPGKIGWHDEQ